VSLVCRRWLLPLSPFQHALCPQTQEPLQSSLSSANSC
jgi:hypothetical protein